MIDIHVLTHSGTRQEWLDQCLESLASEPCTVHVVEGVEGSVGAGRAKGYALGSHPYVSFVDSDDFVLPGAVDACLEGLAKHSAVCTLERAEHNGVPFFRVPTPMHHLFACRRSAIEPLILKMGAAPNQCDRLVVRTLAPKQIGFVGYVWRLHAGQAHKRVSAEARQVESEAWQCS